MVTNRVDTPTTEYFSARSRTPSIESQFSILDVNLAPLSDEGKRSIGISNNVKREYKDKRIYVNPRTGLPVRPPTSFGLFKHAMRRNMKNGKVSFLEFNKKATVQWAKLKEEEKEPYVERAKKLAEQFKKIEVSFLRKKVRQLQHQVKEYRRMAVHVRRSL